MTGQERLPGESLQRLAEALLTRRALDAVVLPALADLQHEHALAAGATRARRRRVLARGYAAFWLALAKCLATWPTAVRRPALGRGSMRQDFKYALRVLARQKAWSALAVLTLALGIGAATTMFSVIQNVIFDPFPGHDVDRVVAFLIQDTRQAQARGRSGFQTPEFLDYQAQIGSFEEVVAGGNEDVLYGTDEGTEQWNGGLLSVNNFSFYGVRAAVGREFAPDDVRPGAPPVFMMSHRLWTARFGADASHLGRTFVLNGVPTTLVGVTPPRWARLAADVYRPVSLDRANPEIAQRFFILQARLKRGVTLAEAEAEIDVVARRVAKDYPAFYPESFAVRVVSLVDQQIGSFRGTLYTLAAAVGLLLLIACGNVANMLLTRATAREREMAVRAAVGASRARLVRQLLLESLILALGGGLLGAALAYAGVALLVASIPVGLIPRQTVIEVDVPVLCFSLLAACATAIVSGLVPALLTARASLIEPLKDTGKGNSGGARRHRVAGALVAAEVALSIVLLAGAGLLMRSFVNLRTVDLGADHDRVLFARLALPRGRYDGALEKGRFLEEALRRIEAIPGVVSAGATSSMPILGGPTTTVDVPGRTHEERWEALLHMVSAGYARTLGLRVRHGELLSPTDVATPRQVAVVNQTLALRYFGEENPVGRTIVLKRFAAIPGAAAFEVVGVVADSRNSGPAEPPRPEVFVPHTAAALFGRAVVVRTAGPPEAVADGVRRELWAVDRGVAVTQMTSLQDALRDFSYAEPRLVLGILGVFAALGLVLVALGVFSVVAYGVARRTHEIGIRMALGAGRLGVLSLVLRGGLRPVAVGALLGVAASLALSRVLASRLFGVTPHDPVTLVAVVLVVMHAGLAACYVPARRAASVEPLVALRHE
jgi:putative ABC transport system permease protein